MKESFWICSAFASDSALSFVELSDVFDCKKGIAKQTKILKMIGELSTTTILRICRHIVNYSSFLQIIPRHTCQFARAVRRTFLEENLSVLKTKKSFGRFFTSLNLGYIFYPFLRIKNDRKKNNNNKK